MVSWSNHLDKNARCWKIHRQNLSKSIAQLKANTHTHTHVYVEELEIESPARCWKGDVSYSYTGYSHILLTGGKR